MRSFPVLLLLVAVACGGEEAVESPEEHACEHRGEAGVAVTAAADPLAAPTITLGEEPYTVTLVDGAVGWVAAEITEAEPALLMVGTADVLTALALDGVEQTLATPAPIEACASDIPEHIDLELTPGRWTFGFGPAGVADVWITFVSAEGHAHEEGE